MFKEFNDIDKDLNYVDKYNLNQTVYGYLIKAYKSGDLSKEEKNKIMISMAKAFDSFTAEQAREAYENSIK